MKQSIHIPESTTTDVDGAAKFFGVSKKTFRDRFMPDIPALIISAPEARRTRRRFSIAALTEALRRLEGRSAA